jgi:hypothetical protein
MGEWMLFHSLTLAATAEMKRVEGNWPQGGLIKCLHAVTADIRMEQSAALRRS